MKVREAVELLGGRMAVGKVLGAKERTISDWMTHNKVSGQQAMSFYDMRKKYGVQITMAQILGK